MDQKEQTKCMWVQTNAEMNCVINADLMTVEEIHQKLDAGYDGKRKSTRHVEVFAEFRQQHENKINVKGGRRCRLLRYLQRSIVRYKATIEQATDFAKV